jgi:PAS domain S-box-containing protein
MAADLRLNALVVGRGDVLATVAEQLPGAGYQVWREPDSDAALAALDRGPLDLIIVVWDAPGGDAERLCRAIRASPRHQDLYILLLVPGDSPGLERATGIGADDYLTLPFGEDALLARIRAGDRQATLRNSEDRLQAVIANVPGAIYRCANDPDWTMKLISDEIERISGYPVSDFINSKVRAYSSVIHPDDREQVYQDVQDAVRQGQVFSLEYRIVRADDHLAWVRERGQQIRDSNGRIWLDGVIFDITGWRQAEDDLRVSQRKLAIADDRQRIARDLHDGVTGSLVGLAAILRRLSAAADDPGKVRESLATSVEQIDSMIDDIRGYMRQLQARKDKSSTDGPRRPRDSHNPYIAASQLVLYIRQGFDIK